MVKAVIMDVDGVIVGKQEGVNFPLPHTDVIAALKQIASTGMPVILCTAKFQTAVDQIIIQAQLNNPHITDGGALIINPLSERDIIDETPINKAVVMEYLKHDEAYTELYGAKNYYVRKSEDPEFQARRTKLLQADPITVDSLDEIAETEDIIKIISYAENDDDMPRIEAQVKRLGDKLNMIWTHHPYIMPRRPCVMTAPGISKEDAAKQVAGHIGIPPEEMLGIGDSPADWSFMRLCGYIGTIGDNKELRRLCSESGKPAYFGKSVDDNSILDVFKHHHML